MTEEKDNLKRPIIDKKTGVSLGVIIVLAAGIFSYATLQTQFVGHVKSPFLHENIINKLETNYVSQTELAPLKEDVAEIKIDIKEIKNLLIK